MTTILEFMSIDHDRLDSKIRTYSAEKLIDIERAESIFLSFKSELERHIIWEEDILFSVFERKTGIKDGGPTSVMRTEHIQIKNHLQEIKKNFMRRKYKILVKKKLLYSRRWNHTIKKKKISFTQG
jgi:iron-sulfur cluster repair protein YtfE (RIC family)